MVMEHWGVSAALFARRFDADMDSARLDAREKHMQPQRKPEIVGKTLAAA
jgi:hypothetical protein